MDTGRNASSSVALRLIVIRARPLPGTCAVEVRGPMKGVALELFYWRCDSFSLWGDRCSTFITKATTLRRRAVLASTQSRRRGGPGQRVVLHLGFDFGTEDIPGIGDLLDNNDFSGYECRGDHAQGSTGR